MSWSRIESKPLFQRKSLRDCNSTTATQAPPWKALQGTSAAGGQFSQVSFLSLPPHTNETLYNGLKYFREHQRESRWLGNSNGTQAGRENQESAVLVFPINFVSELDGLSQQRMLLCCQSSRKAKIRISFGKLRKRFSAGKHMVLSLFGLWENFWNISAVVLICSAIIENTHQFMVNATFKSTWGGNPFALNDFPVRCSDVKCAQMTLPSQFQVRVSKVSRRDRRTI